MGKEAQQRPYGEQGRRVDARMVVGIVVAVLLVVFVFQNTGSTDLRWLFFNFTAPLWLILAITLVVAFGIGWLVGRRRGGDQA